MSRNKRYILNPKTLMYEVTKSSMMSRVGRFVALFVMSIGMSALYFWVYTSVLGLELPKTMLLKKKNAEWCSKVEVMNMHLDQYDEALASLQLRDDDIYHSIFGMDEIPSEVRNAGFGGVNRYAHYDAVDPDGLMKGTAVRMDVLVKNVGIEKYPKKRPMKKGRLKRMSRKSSTNLLKQYAKEQKKKAAEIGGLMKTGKREEAEAVKAEVAALKARSSEIEKKSQENNTIGLMVVL